MAIPLSDSDLQPSGRRLIWQCSVLAGLTILAIVVVYVARRPAHPKNVSSNAFVDFIPGQRLVYQIDFDSAAASDFAALFSDGKPGLLQVFETGLKGQLTITALVADADHMSLIYQFRPMQVQFQVDGQESPAQSFVLQRDLSRPVFGLLDSRGRIQSVRFDAATGPLAKNIARTLLAAIQVVGPQAGTDPQVAPWECEEEDPNGTLVARYEVQADGTIRKTKLRYLQPTPAKKGRTIVLVPTIQTEGHYVATLDAERSLAGISTAEAQSMTIQNKAVGHGTLNLEMRLLRKEESTATELAALCALDAELGKTSKAVTLSVVKSPEEGQLDIQRQELGRATIESLLAELKALEGTMPEEKVVTRLFLKFKALAIMRPESCRTLGMLISSAEPSSVMMHILTDALESAGNAEAQAALGTAIQARANDWAALVMLIPALGAAESPTLQTEQTMQALAFGMHAQNINVTARLALGNVARNLREDSPERSKKIVDRLLKELADPASEGSKWELLLALGNAGSIHALPTLTQLLDDPAPDLRGAAAWAMRWIDSPQVDSVLTGKVLLKDPDRGVRLEAIRALRFREKTPGNFAALQKALAAENEADIRIELLRNLWDFRDMNPQARKLAEHSAETDPAAPVREAAAKLLDQTPKMP